MSPIPCTVSSERLAHTIRVVRDCRLGARRGRLPVAVPLFRSRNRFTVPTLKVGPVVAVVIAGLLVAALVVLAVIEPRPPVRHFEVPVPNERFAR